MTILFINILFFHNIQLYSDPGGSVEDLNPQCALSPIHLELCNTLQRGNPPSELSQLQHNSFNCISLSLTFTILSLGILNNRDINHCIFNKLLKTYLLRECYHLPSENYLQPWYSWPQSFFFYIKTCNPNKCVKSSSLIDATYFVTVWQRKLS